MSSTAICSGTDEIQEQILEADQKFQRACQQVVLLNTLVTSLQNRYDRAVKKNLRTYRYALRLRLCTAEGIRNMYYEYASKTADVIESLEASMREMGGVPIPIYDDTSSGSDDTDDDDVDAMDVDSEDDTENQVLQR